MRRSLIVALLAGSVLLLAAPAASAHALLRSSDPSSGASLGKAPEKALRYEGAAGSTYAPLPSLVISTDTSTSRHAFVGCYVARRANPQVSGAPDPGWRMYSGTLSATAANSTSATLLPATCP